MLALLSPLATVPAGLTVPPPTPPPTCPQDSEAGPRPTVLQLELVEGPLAGTVLTAAVEKGERYQVGRTRSSKTFQIKDPSISEKHAEIVWRGGQWALCDLGSSNGTFLNGEALPEEGACASGWGGG